MRTIRVFERVIVTVLMILLMIVTAISVFELGLLLVRDMATARGLVLQTGEMFELFGYFLLVLIGLELFMTLKLYLSQGVVHVEVVLEVALTALAQMIIILDAPRANGFTLLGLAALVIALAGAFWLVRAGRGRTKPRTPRARAAAAAGSAPRAEGAGRAARG